MVIIAAAEGHYQSFRAGGKNCVQQCTFLEKQGSELRWNRKGDMEVRTVWKQVVHVCYPFVHLDFRTNRTETAFTGMRDVAYLRRMSGAGERGKSEASGLPAIHHFPDVVGYIPGDQRLM